MVWFGTVVNEMSKVLTAVNEDLLIEALHLLESVVTYIRGWVWQAYAIACPRHSTSNELLRGHFQRSRTSHRSQSPRLLRVTLAQCHPWSL